MIFLKNGFGVLLFYVFFNISYANNIKEEHIVMDANMEKKIMQSTLKATLFKNDGKKVLAILYADDEKTENSEYYSCINGEPQESFSKYGHYYLYFYNVDTNHLSPIRIKIFKNFGENTFNTEGAKLTVLSGGKKHSDVLLVSQFGDCSGNFFEAYGFSNDNSHFKKYLFASKKKYYQFYGMIAEGNTPPLVAYQIYPGRMQEMTLQLSTNPGELQLINKIE